MPYTYLHWSIVAILVLRRHAHRWVDGWRRCRAVRSASRARVVLRAAPAEADTGVADGISLHLVDGHLRSVALNKLNEAAAFARRNLDVGDLSKALEERTEFVLGDVSGKPTDKDSGIVWIGELIHRLRLSVVARRCLSHLIHAHRSGCLAAHAHGSSGMGSTLTIGLGSSSRDTHWPVAAVDTLHFMKSTLLVLLIGEADEAIATRNAGDRIGHNLGRLAGRKTILEQGDEDKLVDFGTEISDKDGVFSRAFLTAASIRQYPRLACHKICVGLNQCY